MTVVDISDDQAVARWRRDVWLKRADIDPRNEFDWLGLAIGFFLALGYHVDDARTLVTRLVNERII